MDLASLVILPLIVESDLTGRGRPPLRAHAARTVYTRQEEPPLGVRAGPGRPLEAVGALGAQ